MGRASRPARLAAQAWVAIKSKKAPAVSRRAHRRRPHENGRLAVGVGHARPGSGSRVSADYRLFSRSPWDPHALFDPIFDHLAALLPSPQAPVVAALDDTLCKKTGRHIPGATFARDPQSPPFHVNLCRGARFVQASVLVRATQFLGPARALPVRFEPASPAVKPKNKNPSKDPPRPPGCRVHRASAWIPLR